MHHVNGAVLGRRHVCLVEGVSVGQVEGEEDSEGGGVNMAVPVHNVQLVPAECGGDVGALSW